MKKVIVYGIYTIILIFCIYLFGLQWEKYSKESLRLKDVVYTHGEKTGWSIAKCDSIFKQRDDSLLNVYFPGVCIFLNN